MQPFWKDIPAIDTNMKPAACRRAITLRIVISADAFRPPKMSQTELKMLMPVVKVYRNAKMVCIDGPKKATGRTCELRK
jgi:hypothetical protein